MKFSTPLLKGTLVQRYKRFMADIVLDTGEEITAHCANSGSMLGVKEPGSEVWVSPANNPKRKLKYTWELIKVGKS
ncbi:MAG: DNA/RNA nuclease SfsA, partial [Rhodospirillaceae bacterium]|nr:DNA/RNA nuclease SfsA [Rhodospirillaceae bacterium]